MFSVVCKGNGFAPYLRATATAVGTRIPPTVAVDSDHHPPSVSPGIQHIDASRVELINRTPKAVSGVVNAIAQVRYAHTDIQIPNFDPYRRDTTKDPKKPASETVDNRRAFTYMMGTGVAVSGVVAAKGIVRTLVESMAASKDVLALAKIEVKLDSIPAGKNLVVKWRGKPLFVRHRTAAEIAAEKAVDVSTLRDPEPDEKRTQNPEWLVVIGVCTHLGCVPIANQGDYNGYYCPCHGSHYDASGRIRKGPAPLNLEVPAYEITPENLLIVG